MKKSFPPLWLPANRIQRVDITPVAWFAYEFEEIVRRYNARTTTDKTGGAEAGRFFFLQLSYGRLACFSSWEKKKAWETEVGAYVELSLKVNARGVVYWEDFEEVMDPLDITLTRVGRQGAWNWRRRRPPTAATSARWAI